jgi:SAM-dependent methyltransferase
MNTATQTALRRINRDFYSHHAADFDRTRHPGGWPGWQRVVQTAAQTANHPLRVLDLGCGNGRFALFLERNPGLRRRRPFTYAGIDLSSELLTHARAATAGLHHISFQIDDIEACPFGEAPCDLVVLFGVLHHLPSLASRRRTLECAASAVACGGLLALTCWQFADDPRFETRRLGWSSEAGVDTAELEPGDHLLRWGQPESGARRYCHHTDEPELDRLVHDLPFAEVARYRSDGPSGRQNLYWLGLRDGAASLP